LFAAALQKDDQRSLDILVNAGSNRLAQEFVDFCQTLAFFDRLIQIEQVQARLPVNFSGFDSVGYGCFQSDEFANQQTLSSNFPQATCQLTGESTFP
jgi:hypothetical protein